MRDSRTKKWRNEIKNAQRLAKLQETKLQNSLFCII